MFFLGDAVAKAVSYQIILNGDIKDTVTITTFDATTYLVDGINWITVQAIA